ncbi:MAG: FAD-binding oxidoreductase, partial [Chitinophagaceae bacterium]|nr:FAD-binding oxidoreductase [Chitinophagaceae bacterium]
TSLLQYEIDIPLHQLKAQIGAANAISAYQECAEAVGEMMQIAREIHFTEFKEKQSLYLSAFKKDVPFLKQEYKCRQDAGFQVSLLDQHTLINDYSIRAPAAILSECGAEINAYTFTHALLQQAVRQGMPVYDRTEMVHTTHHKRGITLHTAEG